jgi:hypothetical protein
MNVVMGWLRFCDILLRRSGEEFVSSITTAAGFPPKGLEVNAVMRWKGVCGRPIVYVVGDEQQEQETKRLLWSFNFPSFWMSQKSNIYRLWIPERPLSRIARTMYENRQAENINNCLNDARYSARLSMVVAEVPGMLGPVQLCHS